MVKIESIEHLGWKNCVKISNTAVELIATTEVGPRIIHFGFKGEENVFFVNPAQTGITGGDEWHSFGGHRLWHAPEDFSRTYVPDNFPVKVDQLKDGVRLTADVEKNGTQKIIEIHMDEDEAKVKLNHIIINRGVWTIPLAVWALSVMDGGGKAIVPHPPKATHDERLTPTHTLAIWGYTKMDDPRWTWGDKYFFLQQNSKFEYPQKIGSLNPLGWAAYQNRNTLFIDKFGFDPKAVYPDLNCNFETYTDIMMLEVETLGAMVQLEPGAKAEHLEEWSLHKVANPINNDADVDKYVLPLL